MILFVTPFQGLPSRIRGRQQHHPGEVVLHDVAGIAADAVEGRRPAEVIAADENGHTEEVRASLRDRREAEVLLIRPSRDPARIGIAVVDLRGDYVGHIRITEIPEGLLEEVLRWDVVRVHLRDDVVFSAVLVAPGVVVAGLGPRSKTAGRLVVLLDAAPREVTHTEARAERAHVRAVLFVEDPDVKALPMADARHRLEGLREHRERLFRRHDRGEDRYSAADRYRHRDRVLHEQAKDP